MRIMNFAPFNNHTNDLFADNNILKFKDIIEMEQIKILFDFKNNNLHIKLTELFSLNSDMQSFHSQCC